MSMQICGNCRFFRSGATKTSDISEHGKEVSRSVFGLSKCTKCGEYVKRGDEACTDFRMSA